MKNVLEEILKSKKYSSIDHEVVKCIGKQEEAKYKKQTDIIKSVKNKLHQVHDVFLSADELKDAEAYDGDALLKVHVSTRERLEFYHDFLNKIFDSVTKILGKNNIEYCCDIGAGFNGIALSKYGFIGSKINKYQAIDINKKATDILNAFWAKQGCIAATAVTRGIFDESLIINAEVVFMLKLLPVLINQSSGGTEYILNKIFDKIKSQVIVVSFPTKSLSGRNVGMAENYEKNIINKMPKNWQLADKMNFENEVVYLLKSCPR